LKLPSFDTYHKDRLEENQTTMEIPVIAPYTKQGIFLLYFKTMGPFLQHSVKQAL
jgi:hypothetical protein